MRIYGVSKVTKMLQTKIGQQKGQQRLTVRVGYKAPYALAVHEAVEMKLRGLPRGPGRVKYQTRTGKTRHKKHKGFFWDPQGKGQAKFLEGPSRDKTVQKLMRDAIERSMHKKTYNLRASLLRAGRILKAASQERVPVEFGDLKKSAFVEVD